MNKQIAAIAILSLLVGSAIAASYKVDKRQVSVSGLSSGAFFAVQMHVAYSGTFMGAGVFAGGPFYCSQDSEANAFTQCMFGLGLNVNTLVSLTQQFAGQGVIDPPAWLNSSRVFVYSGSSDTVVQPTVVRSLVQYYQNYIPASNIKGQFNIASQHCLPTTNFGSACSMLGSPYINNCDYDGAGAALNQIYGKLSAPVSSAPQGNIITFDQTKYAPSGWSVGSMSFASQGYAYIPTGCQNGATCKLHVAHHGCSQTTADIGNDFYTYGGYNEWAESNNIIVVYPQAVKSEFLPMNPSGCFDWWGYTDANYSFKNGAQMQTVYNMVQSLIKTGQL
jgi:poly(3-hydroxybutyrate) depolymerase